MYKSPPIYEIPLILQLICSTLYAKDITNCVLVCKTWHDLFSPYMWRNLDDQYELDFKEWTSLEGGLERLLLNAQHIRKLALFDSRLALILQGSRCTHLTRLRIREQMPRMAANAVMALIERNPKLEEILLDQPLNAERDETRLIQTIPKLHRLKKISVDMLWHAIKQLLESIPDSVEVVACGPYVVDYDQEWLEDQDDHDAPVDGEQDDFDALHDGSDSHNDSGDSDEDDDDDSMDDSEMDDDEYGSDGDAFDDDEIEELANSMPPEQLIQMMNGALDEAETGSEAGSDEDEDMGGDSDDSSGSDDSDMYDGELAFKDEKVVEYKDTDDSTPRKDGKGSGGKGGPGPLDLSDDTKRGNLTGLYLDLVLGSDDMLQFLPMLRRFPNLQHFGVPHASGGNLEVLSRVLRRHCPNVDSLSLTQRWTSDTALERLVQDRRQLKQIKIRPPISFEIRTNAAMALAEHAQHLERIDMFGVRMASDDIQTILTTCPNLLSFRLSPYSDPKEPEHTFGSVVGPSGSLTFFNMVLTPWVCTKLKFLSIRLSDYLGSVEPTGGESGEEAAPIKDTKAVELTDQDRKGMVEKVYHQLGRLHELEMLEIGVFHEEVMEAEVDEEDAETMAAAPEEEIQFLPSESGMDFSLASGLDHLKTLKHLQCLRLLVNTDSSALSRLPEAKWIAQHWKRLQYLDGVSAPAWGGIGSEEDTVGKGENPAGYEYLKTKMPDLVIRERV